MTTGHSRGWGGGAPPTSCRLPTSHGTYESNGAAVTSFVKHAQARRYQDQVECGESAQAGHCGHQVGHTSSVHQG